MITIPCLNWMQRVALTGLIVFILQMVLDDKLEGLSLVVSIIVIAASALLVLQCKNSSSFVSHGLKSKVLIAVTLVSAVIAIISTTAYFKNINHMSSEISSMRMDTLNKAIEIDALKEQIKELNLQRFNAER